MPKIQPRTERSHARYQQAPSKGLQSKNPFEIKQTGCKVSRYSTSGFQRTGYLGGSVYEKAKSRQNRHKAVYRLTSQGQAIVNEAVPLGRKGSNARSAAAIAIIREARVGMTRDSKFMKKQLVLATTAQKNSRFVAKPYKLNKIHHEQSLAMMLHKTQQN